MAALTYSNGHSHYILKLLFLSFFLSFVLAYSQRLQIGCLLYFHTWCGLSADLECRSEMYGTRLAENSLQDEKFRQKIAITITQFVWLYLRSSQLTHVSTIRKKLQRSKGRCHGNQILAKIGKKSNKNGHNFSCMRHINVEFDFEIGFSYQRLHLWHSRAQGTKGRYHSNQFWDKIAIYVKK